MPTSYAKSFAATSEKVVWANGAHIVKEKYRQAADSLPLHRLAYTACHTRASDNVESPLALAHVNRVLLVSA
jgi:hypothetical protein